MSAYPLMLEGTALEALVVGGGAVATRKAFALLESGATVRVVAPAVTPALREAADHNDRLQLTLTAYSAGEAGLGNAMLVIAATDDPATNATIAAEALADGRLVNVADAPQLGNCSTPAVHRSGDLVVAVTTGGVPRAATRIRDAIATVFDGRYSSAVRELLALRRSLLDAGRRDRWQEAASALLDSNFCNAVESGSFRERLAQWR